MHMIQICAYYTDMCILYRYVHIIQTNRLVVFNEYKLTSSKLTFKDILLHTYNPPPPNNKL